MIEQSRLHRDCMKTRGIYPLFTIFALTLMFLASVCLAQSANIEVFRDSVIGEVSPYLFGSGDEMSENFSQEGVDSLVSFIGIPLLRMGGISAEYLDWEANDYNGLWHIDVDTLMIIDTLDFSIDSLLQFCERVGVEPILTVNFQINNPANAARMVEYCNGDIGTPMGAVRAARGHPEPYNVVRWCIGNEPDISSAVLSTPWGDWTFYRHFGIPFEDWSLTDSSFVSVADYSALVGVYIDSMRAHSPIPLKIGGLSLAGDLSWISTVIGENNDKIDWLDIHYYPCWGDTADTNYYRAWLATPDTGFFSLPFEDWYRQVCDSVEAYSGGYDIPVHIFEFNSGIIMYYDALWWNYLNGLFIADILGHFMNVGVPMSSVYCIYDIDPPMADWWSGAIIRGDTLSMRAACWVLKLYLDFFGDTFINTTSDVFGLNVYGSVRNDDTLALVVINKNLDSAYTATINLHGFVSNDTMEIWDITNDTVLAAPWNGTKGIIYRGKYSGDSTTFTYTFPKASVTALLIASKSMGIEENTSCKVENIRLEAYPNPFNSSCAITVSYSAGVAGNSVSTEGKQRNEMTLKVYDLRGNVVWEWSPDRDNRHREMSPISRTFIWQPDKTSASGIYLIRATTQDGQTITKRIVYLK